MNNARKKIYFATDAHLGNSYMEHPIEAEKKLCRWLDSIKDNAQAIYFLGDMFDYWYEYKYVVPKGFVRFLGKLAELSDLGIKINFLIGNHDIWMFDYLPKEIGAVIHQGPMIVNLGGARFFLAHGDEVGKQSFGFRLLQTMFRSKICQFFYAGIHPRWSVGFARAWSLSSRNRSLANDPGDYDASTDYLINFATKYSQTHPDIRFFIFGHRHAMLDMEIQTDNSESGKPASRVIYAGDWINSFSYIEWDGNGLALKQFEE